MKKVLYWMHDAKYSQLIFSVVMVLFIAALLIWHIPQIVAVPIAIVLLIVSLVNLWQTIWEKKKAT